MARLTVDPYPNNPERRVIDANTYLYNLKCFSFAISVGSTNFGMGTQVSLLRREVDGRLLTFGSKF